MPTTSNFGWTTPADTDLVKDGAAAIRTLGNGIDTSLVDLKGGTSGQYLIKNSNTDLDFTWTTNTADIDGITASSPLTGGGTSGTITVGIQDATTAQKGAVQLEDSTSSTSITKAATPNSVKSAYDLAGGAIAKSLIDAEGDLIVGDAADAVQRLGIGSNGNVLTVDTSIDGKIKWAAPAGGKVLQVVSATTTTATTIASATLTDTGITASITPTSATSKILVMITAEFKHFLNGNGFSGIAAEVLRGATTIADYNKTDSDEFDFIQYAGSSANTYKSGTTSIIYLDSPATTSSTTYKLQARGYSASVSVTFQQNGSTGSIVLMEIGA
jgi:hypothetical protein